MKIAIPVTNGKLSQHFGHCDSFVLIDVDMDKRQIERMTELASPPHHPGLLPPWLAEKSAELIIAGGMGQRAISMFAAQGIQVIIGAPVESPERLATDFIAGTLEVGQNACDH
jgi:predicted Fe-Mo cluster-binding NifX family protein